MRGREVTYGVCMVVASASSLFVFEITDFA